MAHFILQPPAEITDNLANVFIYFYFFIVPKCRDAALIYKMAAVGTPTQTSSRTLGAYFCQEGTESISVASHEASKLKCPHLPYKTLLKLTLPCCIVSSITKCLP